MYLSNCSCTARRAPIRFKQAVILPKLPAFLGSMCVRKCLYCCGSNGLEKCSFDPSKPSNLGDVSRVSEGVFLKLLYNKLSPAIVVTKYALL